MLCACVLCFFLYLSVCLSACVIVKSYSFSVFHRNCVPPMSVPLPPCRSLSLCLSVFRQRYSGYLSLSLSLSLGGYWRVPKWLSIKATRNTHTCPLSLYFSYCLTICLPLSLCVCILVLLTNAWFHPFIRSYQDVPTESRWKKLHRSKEDVLPFPPITLAHHHHHGRERLTRWPRKIHAGHSIRLVSSLSFSLFCLSVSLPLPPSLYFALGLSASLNPYLTLYLPLSLSLCLSLFHSLSLSLFLSLSFSPSL